MRSDTVIGAYVPVISQMSMSRRAGFSQFMLHFVKQKYLRENSGIYLM